MSSTTNNRRILVFTACYNERDNISPFVEQVSRAVPHADMLVVDDSSPDGTWDEIVDLQRRYPRLVGVKRPGKRGLGSAHKYALHYAMRKGYDYVVTMDADFSHDPAAIPALLDMSGPNVFVTGSRYCGGGHSDYTGYRDIISRLGNIAARNLLNLELKELTTSFRVFDVASLKRLSLRHAYSQGYSYNVQLIYLLRRQGVELREVPIHFADRLHGASKIPRLQAFISAYDLLSMAAKRLLRMRREFAPDTFLTDQCVACGDRALAMKHEGASAVSKSGTEAQILDVSAYKCTSVGGRSYPPVYSCLNCGLEQVPQSLVPQQLESMYEHVVDTTYLANIPARRRTFSRVMDRVEKWRPGKPGTMLEIGSYCGLFLNEAVRRGWDGEGIEPSHWASEYARTKTGARVRTGFLRENRAALKNNYDVVVSWDVLEHVRDPVGFLKDCGSMLPEGGTLFFSTLDVSNWYARLLGKRWPWLIDMHIQYFDARSVKDVLRRAGFELVGHEPYTHYAKLGYMAQGASRVLPRSIAPLLTGMAKIIPDKWMLPVAFGDIKLYVARKVRGGEQIVEPSRMAAVG
jgi:SAM-dependent methyltransferase